LKVLAKGPISELDPIPFEATSQWNVFLENNNKEHDSYQK